MLRTILVPLDGSPRAEQALVPACRLARQTGAGLILLSAVPSATHTGGPLSTTWRTALSYLNGVEARLTAEGYSARTKLVRTEAARAILFTARVEAADLIVMGTHGRTGLRRVLVGSVAEAVVAQTSRPVMLVGPHMCTEAPAEEHRTLLVPLDGTPESEAALRFVVHAGLHRNSDIVLLRVLPSIPATLTPGLLGYDAAWQVEVASQEMDKQAEAARQELDATVHQLLPGTSSRNRILAGDAAEVIAATAVAEQADMIVMTPHQHAALDRIVHGSVTTKVLHHSSVPVLLVPAAEAVDTTRFQVQEQTAATSR